MFLLLINFKSKFCNFHSCIGIPDYRCLAFPQWIFKMKVFIFLIRMKVFHLTVLTSYVFIKVNLLILSLWYIFSCCVIGTFFAVSKLTKYWYQISKLVLLLRKDVNNDPKNTAANNFLKIFLSTKNRKILCYWSLKGKERILYAFLRPILFKK